MIGHGFEGINLDNPLQGKKRQIIEYFVNFYGEQYRGKITNRINNTNIIFAGKTQSQNESILLDYFKYLKSYAFSSNMPIKELTENLEYLEKGYLKLREYYVRKSFSNYNEIYQNVKENYLADFILSKLFLPSNKRDEVLKIVPYYQEIIKDLSSNRIIPKEELYRKASHFSQLAYKIANEFMSASYLADHLNDLFSKENVKRAMILEKQIDEQKHIHINRDLELSYGSLIPDDLIGRESLFDLIEKFILNETQGFVGTNIVLPRLSEPGNSNDFIIVNDLLDFDDATMIHELNHAVVADCILNGNELYIRQGIIVGVFRVCDDFRKKPKDFVEPGNWQEGAMFNEVLNDFFAQSIRNKMRDNGFTIGFRKDRESMYAKLFPLFGHFIVKHFNDLKECYICDDFSATIKYLGKNGFVEASRLANDMFQFMMKNPGIEEKIKNTFGGYPNEVNFFDVARRQQYLYDSEIEQYIDFYRRGNSLFPQLDAKIEEDRSANFYNFDIRDLPSQQY